MRHINKKELLKALSLIKALNIDSLLQEFKKESKLLRVTYSIDPWVEADYIPDFVDYIARKNNIIDSEVYMPKYTIRCLIKDHNIEFDQLMLKKIEKAEDSFRDKSLIQL